MRGTLVLALLKARGDKKGESELNHAAIEELSERVFSSHHDILSAGLVGEEGEILSLILGHIVNFTASKLSAPNSWGPSKQSHAVREAGRDSRGPEPSRALP